MSVFGPMWGMKNKVLYHMTALPPARPECEAISQEIRVLRARFKGDVVYLNPNQNSPLPIPRLLFGFHKLRALRRREHAYALHHIYNADPFPYPALRFLRRPVLYMIDSGVGERRPNIKFFNTLAGVTVYDTRSQTRLQHWGVHNVYRIRPSIDTVKFTCTPQPLDKDLHVLVGSAPWTPAQFETKGVDALLAAAQRSPHLHLTFLWRGVLFDAMMERVRALKLEGRVRVINRQVNVNNVLATVHAAITLATAPSLVKAYPHSLLDALAAGKPVLVSETIPMADYVKETGCGEVIARVTPEAVLESVTALRDIYDERQTISQAVGQRDFTLDTMLESFQEAYMDVL